MSRFDEPLARDHARARELAAARLGEPLDPDEASWLETHLAWCAPCRAVAGEYGSQRLELRALRLDAPIPPRDLWARTSAALGLEQVRKGVRTATPRPRATIRSRRPLPYGALSGVLAVLVVVVVTTVSGVRIQTQRIGGQLSASAATASFMATPFPVPARTIPLIVEGHDTLSFSNTSVQEVCPLDVGPSCSVAALGAPTKLTVSSGEPVKDAVMNPSRSHMVIVQHSDAGAIANSVLVVPIGLKEPTPSKAPPSTALASPSSTPASSRPGSSPSPTPAQPSGTPGASPSSTPSSSPASVPPSNPATQQPSGSPPASQVPPSLAATPDPNGAIQIAADVVVVGRSAAYSPGGSMFAFTARPSDRHQGPDVYVWRAGTELAVPVTADHHSIFSGWVGNQVLLSRGDPDTQGDAREVRPVSVLLDPSTLHESLVSDEAMFRPTVHPTTRKTAIWWDGTVQLGADGLTWVPATGRLVMGTWPAGVADGSADPNASRPLETLTTGPVADWDARWDSSGTRLALWVADDADPASGQGKLSLYRVDGASGRVDRASILLDSVPAMEGISIGSGRLVWETRTSSGKSKVEVLAWTDKDVGQVEVGETDTPLVIVRSS